MEAKRVLGSRLFLAVLAGLLVLNGFFYLYQRPDTWDDPRIDGELYHTQLEQLKDKSMDEALAWCVDYQAAAEEAMFAQTWDRESEAEQIRIVAAQLEEQYAYLLDYENYLDRIEAHAKLLQSVSLFGDPDSVAYKNTVKTAEDFREMRSVTVSVGHDLSVTEFFSDKWTDYSIVILMCVVCGMFLAERKEGLWSMIHATSGGRGKLALCRTGILLAAAWIGTVTLVGSRILLCGMEYHGLGEWGRILQSIPMFQNVPTPMTIGQFWLLYLTTKALGAFWLGLVLWAVLSAISNLGLAIGAAGLLLGTEFACTAIPLNSMFAAARYVNVFSYVDFGSVFPKYLNISVFGVLISGSSLVLAMLPFLCVAFTVLNVIIAERKRPVSPLNRLLRWFDRVQKRLDPVFCGGGEARKLLIKRKGILLLLLLAVLVGRGEAPPRTYVPWDPYIQFYEEKYAGPITVEKLQRMEADLAYCADPYNQAGFQIVMEAAKNAPAGAWIIPTAPYDAIWSNNEGNYHRTTALMALLILVLVLSPIASQERQNGMTVLLQSTAGGRKRLTARKQVLLLSVTALIWAMVYGAELYRTIGEYGMFACVNAPAYSLELFDSSLPLGLVIAVYYGAKLLVMAAVGEVCFFLSSRCEKNRDAILLCCGVILLPAALAAIGSAIGSYLSFLIPLGGAELLW